MKAHIVGGGFGGLAAAGYLIRNAGVPGRDITVYETEDRMGGALPLWGDAKSGYILPAGSVFDAQFRCTNALLADVPSQRRPGLSVKDEFFKFNAEHPFNCKARIIDADLKIVRGRRFGLSWRHGYHLARLALTPERKLEGRRIDEYFSKEFFATEFWLIYSSIMGSLPQHGATELRRYLNRTLHLFPVLSNMSRILRSQRNQYEAFIVPLVAWLREHEVNFIANAFVRDIHFAPSPDRITVDRFDYEQKGALTSVAVAPDDLVIATIGSQGADMSVGAKDKPPVPQREGKAWELWKRLAEGRPIFGRPEKFFGADKISDSRWVTFTVTTTGEEFLKRMEALTGNETGTGGLVTLKDSPWMLSLSIFDQPEVDDQPDGTSLWWGYGLFPERVGKYVMKRMDACTGEEILEELLRHLRFDDQREAIMKSSICIPVDLPYVNNIWLPRGPSDRPPPVPEGSTNLGLVGQYVEVPLDVAFTVEYSARCAWEAIHVLLKRGPAPPPVYQAQRDLKALLCALWVFLFK